MKQSDDKKKFINRRTFLSIVAVSVAARLFYCLKRLLEDAQYLTLRHGRQIMGPHVNFTLTGPYQESCQAALLTTIQRMEYLEGILSRHQPESMLARLHRTIPNQPQTL